jgi:hypothetical protein
VLAAGLELRGPAVESGNALGAKDWRPPVMDLRPLGVDCPADCPPMVLLRAPPPDAEADAFPITLCLELR